jgi:hypothetical protein
MSRESLLNSWRPISAGMRAIGKIKLRLRRLIAPRRLTDGKSMYQCGVQAMGGGE